MKRFLLATSATGLAVALAGLAPDLTKPHNGHAAVAQTLPLPSAIKKYLPGFKKKKRRRRQEREPEMADIPLPQRNPVRLAPRRAAENREKAAERELQALQRDYQARLRRVEEELRRLRGEREASPSHSASTIHAPFPHPLPRRQQRSLTPITPETKPVPLPQRNWRKVRQTRKGQTKKGQTTRDQPQSVPAKPGKAPLKSPTLQTVVEVPDHWSDQEIRQARAVCERILSRIAAKTAQLPAIRKGACGTPAPIKIFAIGNAPAVKIRPAAVLNCRMLPALATFLKHAQVQAQKDFGAPIVSMQNASGYVCRHRYNDPKRKLSQHALANALDIPALTLANGRKITVLGGWGPTRRDLQKRKDAAAEAAKNNENQRAANARVAALETAPKQPPTPGRTSVFLKTLHRLACKTFGTVLGPEANDAHRDHFHFDLAPRRRSNYCE